MRKLLYILLFIPFLCQAQEDELGWNQKTQSWISSLPNAVTPKSAMAVNIIITRALNDGNYQYLDRLWVFAIANQANARVDIVGHVSVTEVNTPTWTSFLGYTYNGTSNYVNLNFQPSTNSVQYTLNNCMLGGYISGSISSTSNTQCLTGVEGAGPSLTQCSIGSTLTGIVNEINESTSTSYSASYSSVNGGYYYISRTANGNNKVIDYGNKGAIVSPTSTNYTGTNNTVNLPAAKAFCGALNDNGTTLFFMKAPVAMCFYGSGSISPTTFYTDLDFGARLLGCNQ